MVFTIFPNLVNYRKYLTKPHFVPTSKQLYLYQDLGILEIYVKFFPDLSQNPSYSPSKSNH